MLFYVKLFTNSAVTSMLCKAIHFCFKFKKRLEMFVQRRFLKKEGRRYFPIEEKEISISTPDNGQR